MKVKRLIHGSRLARFALASIALLWGITANRLLAAEITVALSGTNVTLQDVSATTEVYFQSMRLNRALNQWNFELKLRNTATRALTGPVVVLFETVTNATGPLSPDGVDATGKPWVDMSAKIPALGLEAGQDSQLRTLALGLTSGAPRLTARVFSPIAAGGLALALANVVDEVGHPLSTVQILESGPDGAGSVMTDSLSGLATVGRGAGMNTFVFSAPDYLPVWRRSALANGSVTIVPTPRLVLRETNAFQISAASGLLSNRFGNVRVTIPAGAFTGSGQAMVTALTPQALPAFLPTGWSPLHAFWMELSQSLVLPLPVKLYLLDTIKSDETAALVRWNDAALKWQVTQLVPGTGASVIDVALGTAGAFALVVPDRGTTAPPAPSLGQDLQGGAGGGLDYAALSGRGIVLPSSSPANRLPELVTAQAQLVVSNSVGALASGTLFRGETAERYHLQDGSDWVLPTHQVYLVGYQRPGDSDVKTLEANFPMRPQLLLGAEDLLLGSVKLTVLPPTDFVGGVINTNGLTITNGDIRLTIRAGAVTRAQAVQLDQLDLVSFTGLLAEGFTAVGAFQLHATGLGDQPISFAMDGLSPSSLFVLARVRSEQGIYGLEPVERLATDGQSRLTSIEPATGSRLPGLTSAGQFVLVQVSVAQSLLVGTAQNALGQAAAGLLVRREPWMTFSGAGGAFQLLSPAGNAQVRVLDLPSGDLGLLDLTVPVGGSLTGLSAVVISEGPRVLAVNPADGAGNISRVTAVEVTLSKPINPATLLSGGVQLLGVSNQPVVATVSLNLANTIATLLSSEPLPPFTLHTLMLSTNIADTSGRKLAGQSTFTFRTVNEVFDRTGGKLTSYEPVNGQAGLVGGPGTAEPDAPVILVNETTGRTSTVRSKPDGSFSNAIPAEVDDRLSAVLVNGNGTRNQMRVSRQKFLDGSEALFDQGGTMEIAGENGPIQFIVEPGAIPGKTKFKFESVALNVVTQMLNGVQPVDGGKVLGGIKMSAIQGAALTKSIDVRFPINLSDVALPADVSPTNCGFGLAIARVVDGATVYELIDRMLYEDGHLVTHSPPFFGLLGPYEDLFLLPFLMVVNNTPMIVTGHVFAKEAGNTNSSGTIFLGGAFITGKANSDGAVLGRLRPGSVYTTSSSEPGTNAGRYTLMANAVPGSTGFVPGLTATHPLFPGQKAELEMPTLNNNQRLTIGNVYTKADLIFPLPPGGMSFPPGLAASYTPTFPSTNVGCILTVAATDNVSTPTISVAVERVRALIPGQFATPSDVVITLETDAATATSRQQTYKITTYRALQAVLKLRALDSQGNPAEQLYPIAFGAEPPAPAVNPPVADTNDHTAPLVIYMSPSPGSTGLSPGQPIVLRFNEPIRRESVTLPYVFALDPIAGTPEIKLSEDQREVQLTYPGITAGKFYSFTASTAIEDLNHNSLDQNPLSPNNQQFSASFRSAPARTFDFPVQPANRGVVGSYIQGNYAYVLDRSVAAATLPLGTNLGSLAATDLGRLAVYELTNPALPSLVGEYLMPPFPRDLVRLPNYSFYFFATNDPSGNPVKAYQTDTPGKYINGYDLSGNPIYGLPIPLPRAPRITEITNRFTNDLVAIVGGLAGSGESQWLRIVDASDPAHPRRLAGTLISTSTTFIPGRLRWSPPYLAYMESGERDRISLVNLQSLLMMELLSQDRKLYQELPMDGFDGIDLNQDGDYTDDGEKPPLPERHPAEFGGKLGSFVLPDTSQPIRDFVVENAGGFIGVIVGPGFKTGPGGIPLQPKQEVPGGYRTLLNGGLNLTVENSQFDITNGSPRRMLALMGHPLVMTNGTALRDLVCITVNRQRTNDYLLVLDVTEPLNVTEVLTLPLPLSSTGDNVNSILLREDGLLAVAGDGATYLINPALFQTPFRADETHPAFVGTIDGVGGFPRSFASTLHGYHLSADENARGRLVQSPPQFSFVHFPPKTPFGYQLLTNLLWYAPTNLTRLSPTNVVLTIPTNLWRYVPPVENSPLANLTYNVLTNLSPAQRAQSLAGLERVDFLEPSFLHQVGRCDSVSSRLSWNDYHVLINAPGGAGAKIELALESLDWAGQPLRKRGLLFPPVHALSAGALHTIDQTPDADDAPVRTLTAWRMSDDPGSDDFNRYISRPFWLITEALDVTELTNLTQRLDHDLLWSGQGLRASIDPVMASNGVLGPYAGEADIFEKVIKAGAETSAQSFPGDLIPSPNPGPINGEFLLPTLLYAASAHSSELVMKSTDLVLPGRRLPISFQRTFRGQAIYDGPFGRGWDFNFNQRVVEAPTCIAITPRDNPQEYEGATAGDLIFHPGGAPPLIFRLVGTNPPPEIALDPLIQNLGWIPRAARFYLPPEGMFSPMIKFKDGRFVRLDPDGKQTWFNAAGRLDRIYDRYERNFQELVYNQRGQLIRIWDDVHRPLDLGYYRPARDPLFRAGVDQTPINPTDVGRVCRLRDYSGRDVRYLYTSDGLLDRYQGVEITSGPVNTFRGRQEIKYRYTDGSNPPRSAKSLTGVDAGDVGGVPLLSVTGRSAQGRDVISRVNIMGQATSISQNFNNLATEMEKGGANNLVNSPDGSWSRVGLDTVGRPTESVMGGLSGPTMTNRQEYLGPGANRGLVRATTSPSGDRTEYTYDLNNPVLRSRGNLLSLKKTPGPRGGPILEASTAYDGWYNLPSGDKLDFSGVPATVVLTPDRRNVEHVTRAGDLELFTYNEFGQIETHTSMDGITSMIGYNPDGFVKSRQEGNLPPTTFSYAPVSAGASDPGQRGKPASVTDPAGVTTQFLHDELDRVIAEEREGALTSQAFDQVGNVTERITQVETNRVVAQQFIYGSHGFLREQRVLNVETYDGLSNIVTQFEPDTLNRVRRMVTPSGEEHKYFYDHLGQLVVEEIPGCQTNILTHDLSGNVVQIQKGNAIEQFIFDGHDRLIGVIGANGTASEYVLDANGNALTNRITDKNHQLLHESWASYDALNRMRSKGLRRDDGSVSATYDYYSVDRKMVLTDALGQTVESYSDPLGRVTRVVSPHKTVELTYDLVSNLQSQRSIESGNTYETTFEYNRRRQLTAVTNNLGYSRHFTVEVDGRMVRDGDRENHITTNVFTLLGELAARIRPTGVTQTNQYDLTRNLVAVADHAGNTARYQFDAQNHAVTNYLPNGRFETYENFNLFGLPQLQRLPRGVTVTSGFDLEGKLTNRIVTGLGPTLQDTYEYDGLRRYSRITDHSGVMQFRYDLGGYLRDLVRTNSFGNQPVAVPPLANTVSQKADSAGFRTNLIYPNGGFSVVIKRDLSGRMTALGPIAAEAVLTNLVWAGDSRPGSYTLGNNRIRLELFYDAEPRLTGKRYTRVSDGAVLADLRYAFDRNGAVLARQQMHRGGLTDFFQYDSGNRLTRTDIAARPGATPFTNSIGFAVAGVGGDWRPGPVAREAIYSKVDLLTQITTRNPLGQFLTPMPTNFNAPDEFVCVRDLDGFARQVDDVGNVTRTLLAVRIPGVRQPELVAANLSYNALGQLERVERDDGVIVYFDYDAFGIRMRKAVTGPAARCVPSDIAYLYNDGLLLEERDLGAGAALLRRYYYGDDSDELLAADVRTLPGDPLNRVYFLTDPLRSVISITDAAGAELERRSYDTWGQPVYELPDTSAPQLSSVRQDTNGLVMVFSEPVLPALTAIPNPTNGPVTALPALSVGMRILAGGNPIAGTFEYEDREAAGGFGSVIRFLPDQPLSGPNSVVVDAGFLLDEWNNRNPAIAASFTGGQPAGTVLFTGAPPGSTRPALSGSSATSISFGFHGQCYDEETGLLYCRERYYDAYTGTFTQRDPSGYEDSVNQYAGFANNPVNFRDPTGASVASDMRQMGETLQQDAADDLQEGGLVNDMQAKYEEALGNLLSMPSAVAESWELLNSPSQGGSLDLLRRIEAAETLARAPGQVKSVLSKIRGHYRNLRSVSGFMARRVQGLQRGIQTRVRNAQARRATHDYLVKQGLTSWEAEGMINFQAQLKAKYGAESVELAVRSFGDKAAARRGNREKGMATKSGVFGDKTGTDAKARFTINHGGQRIRRELTGDIDLYYIKVDGRTLSESEVGALRIPINQAIGAAYRRQTGRGLATASVHHGAHINLPELHGARVDNYGAAMQKTLGVTTGKGQTSNFYQTDLNPSEHAIYGAKKLGMIDGPGAEAFAIRSGASGQVQGFAPEVSMLRKELDAAAKRFKERTGRPVTDIEGFDWYKGFPQ